MQERFIKVNGKVYYESQLEVMSNKQLENLIQDCKDGIEEIERKRNDYEQCPFDEVDKTHYNEVISKFKTASVYLQSDIVMLSKMLKAREDTEDNSDEKLKWLIEYCRVINGSITKWKKNKAVSIVNEKAGTDYSYLFTD